MSLLRAWMACCDVCGAAGPAAVAAAVGASHLARRNAQAAGWAHEAGYDICLGCHEKGWRALRDWGEGGPSLRRTR